MSSVSVPGQPLSTEKPSYSVRPGEAARDEPVIIGLWRAGGLAEPQDDGRARARYDWFYRSNPQGQARLTMLWSDREDAPVGSLAIGARSFIVNGRTLAAGVLVDFVVAPRHRSVLPALTLQREARQQAIESVPVIYGMPDTKAVALCRRLPTDVAFNLQRLVRVVRSRVYLNRMMPALVAEFLGAFTDVLDRAWAGLQLLSCRMGGEWVTGFDESFDELWNRTPQSGVCIGVRNRRFLQWRFLDKPGPAPYIYAVRDRGTRTLCMYFICELCDGTLSVKDFLHAGTARDLKRGLLMLAAAARRLGANSVSIHVAGDDTVRRALRHAQYLCRSERPFFAVLHPSAAGAAKGCSWFITQADEDV
jgi:hypothetical protein